MAMFQQMSFTKSWILSKYSNLIFDEEKVKSKGEDASSWQNLDSAQCGEPIYLSITPTNFLMVNHGNDIQEFINLFGSKEILKGLYVGNSLLIILKQSKFLRKFRVQFLEYNCLSSQQACLECVKELKQYFEVVEFQSNDAGPTQAPSKSNSSSKSKKQPPAEKSVDSSQKASLASRIQNTLKFGNSTIFKASNFGSHNSAQRTVLSNSSQSTFSKMDISHSAADQSLSLKEIIDMLLSKNLERLPLFYQQIEPKNFVDQDAQDRIDPKEKSFLTEFITSSLMDSKFPAFVETVEDVLKDVIEKEMNIS